MQELLFITSNRLGDAVLTTGALAELLARYPDGRVTVVAGPLPLPLFRAAPRLHRLLPLVKEKANLHWLKLWPRLCLTRWTALVDFRNSLMTRLLWAERSYRLLRLEEKPHRVLENSAAMRAGRPLDPVIWLDDAARAAAAALVPVGLPVLALAPTANWSRKQWPAESFLQLAQRLTGPAGILPGARIALFGAAHEREQAAPLLAGLPSGQVVDLIGKGDPLTAAACLARCAFFVGNDSGLMHIAAALGMPALGLFGPSNSQQYYPWGPQARWVRAPESTAVLMARAAASPQDTGSLMHSLTVAMAQQAAEELWQQQQQIRTA